MTVPSAENLQQTRVEVGGDRGNDIKPQRNPSPPTIAEKEVLGIEGILIPLGKLEQFRKDFLETGITSAHTNVLLPISDIDTVESGKTNGMEEEKRMEKKKR